MLTLAAVAIISLAAMALHTRQIRRLRASNDALARLIRACAFDGVGVDAPPPFQVPEYDRDDFADVLDLPMR
jgi:hypothetical protein